MEESLEVIIKILSILGIVVAFARLFIIITNRSIVEIILISNRTRMWEDFLEVIFVVLILIFSLTIPVIFVDINNLLLGIVLLMDLVAFVVSAILLIMCCIVHFFKPISKRNIKIINVAIFINMSAIFVSCPIWTAVYKSELLNKISGNHYIQLIYIYLSLFIIFLATFYFYRKMYVYFNGKKLTFYKVELVDINILNSLFYIFSLDNDRQIFTPRPADRKNLSLPIYVFYPKEKILYKYYQKVEEKDFKNDDAGFSGSGIPKRSAKSKI